MPLPFCALAVPVLHSSGAWIASTAAGGYLAGTLSSTWIGAFIAGNAGFLGGLGLVSAAGIFGSSGVLAGWGSAAGASLGSGLTAVGLGGLATKLGLAPSLFLGLTPMGWAIVGSAATIVGSGGFLLLRRQMKLINEERSKGGLGPITWRELIREVKRHEAEAISQILEELSLRPEYGVQVIDDGTRVVVGQRSYPVSRVKYRVNENGSEELLYASRVGVVKVLLVVKPGTGEAPELA